MITLKEILSRTVKRKTCIIWTGLLNKCGRPTVNNNVNPTPSVVRLVWILHHGPIKRNMCVIHTCNNKTCVNIKHLYTRKYADKRNSLIHLHNKVIADYHKNKLTRDELVKKYKHTGLTEHIIRQWLHGQFRSFAVNGKLIVNKKAHVLTDKKLQLILGTLLGDGSLTHRKNTYILSICHCKKQRGYIHHKAKTLKCKVYKIKNKKSYSKDKYKLRISYQNKGLLRHIAKIVKLNKNGKSVNSAWLKLIKPMGLAYWFMDDGSSVYGRNNTFVLVRFHTNGFTLRENKKLQKLLLKFNIETTLPHHQDGYGYNISLRQKSVNHFMDLVSPFIHKSMRYKIKRKENHVKSKRNNKRSKTRLCRRKTKIK